MLIFAVGLVSEFQNLGIDTNTLVKNSDNTRTFTHVEKVSELDNNFIFANADNVRDALNGETVDVYNNFSELAENETEYKVESVARTSNSVIIAIHGGGIEIGTSQLAKKTAELGLFNYYSFRSQKTNNNRILHVTSTNFDEPTAIEMVENSQVVISIHGCAGENKITYLGGLDTILGNKIKQSLESSGFFISTGVYPGVEVTNICNRGITKKGVQLELSTALRKEMLSNTNLLNAYAQAIKEGMK